MRSTGYPVAIFDFSVYGSDSEKTAEEFVDEVEEQPRKKLIWIALLMMIGKL